MKEIVISVPEYWLLKLCFLILFIMAIGFGVLYYAEYLYLKKQQECCTCLEVAR